jgi:FtsP/CotA-like multicopper oxidase with cupredoxin domain
MWWIGVGAVIGLVFAGMQAAEQPGRTSAAAAARAVQVTLADLTIRPASIAVPAGTATTLQVRNAGQVAHSFAVAAPDRTLQTPQLAAGESASLALPALPAGSYRAWCTVPGHKEAGMTATLVAGTAEATGQAGMAGMADGGGQMSAMAMAEGHKASMSAFPAKTAGLGGKVLQPRMVRGVKVFELTAKQVRWEVAPGQFKDAYAFNGTVPGPELRVFQGDRVRVVLDNRLPEPTTVHFHGVTVGNADDGVPYVTQPPVMPGKRFAYEFTVTDAPGTFMYHSHFNSAEQVGRGLFGGFVVEPPKRAWDVEYTEFISDGQLGYAVNGKGWPATAPLLAKPGQRVLVRLLNAGELLHPFHLHGYHFDVLAEDGAARRSPERADTIVVAPGQRFDLLFRADHPGVWAFHCHVLSHVEGPNGMFGMATAVVVK